MLTSRVWGDLLHPEGLKKVQRNAVIPAAMVGLIQSLNPGEDDYPSPPDSNVQSHGRGSALFPIPL